uniref:Spike glycoprotein n=1 Tax=Alphacoronavirus sp. TaxID=1906673 RepID=A0A8F1CXM8_9ALPC|nr:spike glycoprotein [Alphacoronavirus sp.]
MSLVLLLCAVVTAVVADSSFNTAFNGTCTQGDVFKYLKLGLPANTTALVTGYLPIPQNWICAKDHNQQYWFHASGVHGIFLSYMQKAERVEIGVSSGRVDPTAWSLYFSQKNSPQGGDYYFRICKWPARYTLQQAPWGDYHTSCLVNVKHTFNFGHDQRQIVGVTWSGDTVRLYTTTRTLVFHIANDWSFVSVLCYRDDSCNTQIVKNLRTVNVTTQDDLITDYNFVSNSSEMASHLFAVAQGGYIPADFSFNGWFLLTNHSTIINGRLVSVQPLIVTCLWPIPGLASTTRWLFFNGTSGISCNGYHINGAFDTLRFGLNFSSTSERVLDGHSEIRLKLDQTEIVFTCSNTSTYNPNQRIIPFGNAKQPFYCFAVSNGTATFVGMLPVVLREIVITVFGGIYLNGYRVFQLPYVSGVLFNVTGAGAGDFWTVAMTKHAEVLLQVNGTAITNLLYCDTPLNKLKCQQMQFALPNGFYPTARQAEESLPRTFVTLPRYVTHMDLILNMTMALPTSKDADGDCTYRPGEKPSNITMSFNGLESVCINTTEFTPILERTFYNEDCDSRFQQFYRPITRPGTCPFTFEGLKNYVSYGRLCFSTVDRGAMCTMDVYTVGVEDFPIAKLYVDFATGSAVTGVPTSNIGVTDNSVLVTENCTLYTIYGFTGRGIIREANATYLSGIMYTSEAGQLLGFKNVTTSTIYTISPCDPPEQVAVISDTMVGIMSSRADNLLFNKTITTPTFYYHTDSDDNCTEPVITYSSIGVCADGSIVRVDLRETEPTPSTVIGTGNISIPTNFTVSVQAEYVQMSVTPVTVDCGVYVCNGNPHCLRLLTQYATACKTIEQALQLSARLESVELNSMLTYSTESLYLANVSTFGLYNLSSVLPDKPGGRSFIEDILFDKVVTSGLGTVDEDYKRCTNGWSIADLACAQYYNGIMVLPGVVDANKMAMYTGSLLGGMALGGLTSAAATPFALAVQSRLNYVALQTDVLQKNQQILANSFNAAIGNITVAFGQVSTSLQQTADAIGTVANALNKVQGVVNQQGQALHQLTKQLAFNFQAISSSIDDIYNRLDSLSADAQVDRLINGRLAALNAFVSQSLTQYAEVRASRALAQEKINECVKSQSNRFGFCGNGTHLFTIPNAAPNGIMLLHTVLVPTEYVAVTAFAGFCAQGSAFVLKNPGLSLFYYDGYKVSSRHMYEPRVPSVSDFVRVQSCDITYVNISSDQIQSVVPEYIDVNKTLEEFIQNQNYSKPDFNLDIFNQTYLNLSAEISLLENRSAELELTAKNLEETIKLINSTLVDLEWLNRFENYVKWPWWVWLLFIAGLTILAGLMLYCCLATGCCGCCSCLTSSLDFRGRNLQRYEVEKVHVQ